MKRCFALALMVLGVAAVLAAQSAQPATPKNEPKSDPKNELDELASRIGAELEVHGERVLGREAMRWSTRLEGISDCRAVFSVRVSNNVGESTVGEPTVRTESVNFSLGAIDRKGIDPHMGWMVMPCLGKKECVVSSETCSKTSKSGIVIDCTTASQQRSISFDLHVDNQAAALRLAPMIKQAIDICRAPVGVTF